MRALLAITTLALFLAPFAVPGSAGDAAQPDLAAAEVHFKAGRFSEAEKLFSQIAAKDPKQYQAAVRLGYLALLSNKFDEAQKWLEKATALRADEAEPKVLLAEVYYRRDEFEKAAPLVRAAGKEKEAKAKKLESFKGQTPYTLRGKGESTTLKFVRTDPLPLIRVAVNGKEAVFFIDTGASEVFLDTDFAKELGIKQFGSEEGTFSGDKKASVQHGKIDSLTLGDWTLENLPVAILNTRVLSKDLEAKQIDGIIGTVLLYHFLATMDYPKGELVLRRKTPANLKPFEEVRAGRSVVPFWMADDHFMVAHGRIDKHEPTLFFLDSGLAGGDLKLAESVIAEAGIKLQKDKAIEGVGAAGKLVITPFEVKRLSLGEIVKSNAEGVHDGPFPWEKSFGFKLAGMIGHNFNKPYALTFDFVNMRVFFEKAP